MSEEAGRDVVRRIRDALEPLPAYVAETPGGFAWWPHACALRVERAGEVRAAGVTWERVRVRHELVRGVGGSAPQFAVLSDWNARHPGLSALHWDGDSGVVSLAAAADVHGPNAQAAARRLASAALLQLGDARRDAEALAAALGGELARSAPPGGTVREDADALCEGWHRYAEAGRGWALPATAIERAAAISPPPWLRARVDAGGLHAELPCAPAGPGDAAGPGSAVATLHLLVAQPHPILGGGLLCALRLPADAEPVEGRRFSTAALLNDAEQREWSGADALGAWCVHPSAGLSHAAFHPALLVDEDLPAELAWAAGVRARWATAFLARVAKLRSGG